MRRLVFVALLAVGCGSESGGPVLTGTIDGAEWTLNSAYSDNLMTSLDEVWVVLLGGSDTGTCLEPNTTLESPKLQLRVPREPGEYDIAGSGARTINLYIPPSNSSSIIEGLLIVDEVTESTVRASLTIGTGLVELDGAFESPICP